MATQVDSVSPPAAVPTDCLPLRVTALYITGSLRDVSWLADALETDRACNVELRSAEGMAAGLAHLRDELVDVVLISHEPPDVDGLELVDAIRGGDGEGQAVVVLGSDSEQAMGALCYESGADAYVSVETATTRGLLWTIARALRYRRVIADVERLRDAETHRLDREHEEAQRILAQQRQLANLYGQTETTAFDPSDRLPGELVGHYRELLRAYVIMGSGGLDEELRRFVSRYLAAGFCANEAVLLHVQVLEGMIRGLGNRSGRHVMNRANLLIMEMMIMLSNGYRKMYRHHLHPPQQRLLPGCEDLDYLGPSSLPSADSWREPAP